LLGTHNRKPQLQSGPSKPAAKPNVFACKRTGRDRWRGASQCRSLAAMTVQEREHALSQLAPESRHAVLQEMLSLDIECRSAALVSMSEADKRNALVSMTSENIAKTIAAIHDPSGATRTSQGKEPWPAIRDTLQWDDPYSITLPPEERMLSPAGFMPGSPKVDYQREAEIWKVMLHGAQGKPILEDVMKEIDKNQHMCVPLARKTPNASNDGAA